MKSPVRFAVCIVATILLVGCVMPMSQTPTPTQLDINQVVSLTLTADAVQNPPPVTNTPAPVVEPSATPTEALPPPATATSEPTFTPTPPPTTPAPTPTSNCENSARLTAETVPDDTVVQPGATFEKTWTLENTGTCTWTSGYTLVFSDGVRMGGASPVSLSGDTPPDARVTVQVNLTAPTEPGVHRGNWRLADARGALFGLGESANKPFWVQIAVPATAGGMDLGAPLLSDDFSQDQGRWSLGKSNGYRWEIKNGALVLTAEEEGSEIWRITQAVKLTDFYLELNTKTGGECSGKDSYGVVVRTTDPDDDSIYDSAYVFGFSCDGSYRVYRMDNGTYNGVRNWTSTDNLKAGADQANTLGIWANGSNFRLFVNGLQVYEFEDDTHAEGYLGLYVRSTGTKNFQVSVESLKIWELNE